MGPPSVALGLKILVKPAAPVLLIVHLCEQKQKKIVFFRYIYSFCARNSDDLNLLIKTGNAHKKVLLQIIINSSKRYEEERIETQSKMMVMAKW